MRIGTSHFPTLHCAIRYYAEYGFDDSAIAQKIRDGEINIGKPALGANERLVLIDNGNRYAIETEKRKAPPDSRQPFRQGSLK